MIEKPKLPIPVLSIDAVLRLRDKLEFHLLNFLGHTLVRDTFRQFVDEMHKLLQNGILRSTVETSLQALLKVELTGPLLHKYCWLLAGNIKQLQESKPVFLWERQLEYEWVPMRVCTTNLTTRNREIRNLFTFECLAGSLASVRFTQEWSNKKTRYLASYRNEKGRGFGFGRSRINSRGEQQGQLLFRDFRQFYNLRFFGLIDPNKSKDGPYLEEIGHSTATMKYNIELTKNRLRRHSPCIRGFPKTLDCLDCYLGADQCSRATHPLTMVVKDCHSCSSRSLFDPAETDYPTKCANCALNTKRGL
jgi:hypothetical protein